jgi:hypothetical protein
MPNVADFRSPRIIIWYQKECLACKNSEEGGVFSGLVEAGRVGGFTVHKVEATPEMLQRFPHVVMVPLYDIVMPSDDAGACSPYGPQTTYHSIRNDMTALRERFPDFTLKKKGDDAAAAAVTR